MIAASDLLAPFADGAPVADWRGRAARIGALAGVRDPAPVSYGIALTDDDRAVLARAFHGVESVERLAMSAIAHAITRLAPPPEVAATLCGVFYDEARHLDAIAGVQALEPCADPWIAAKRVPFWRLLRDATELGAFVWHQHCLSEAEGAIAGAEKLHQLARAGASPAARAVAERIFVEETAHARVGFHVLAALDAARAITGADFARWTARYLEVEPLVDPALAKGRRQRRAHAIATAHLAHRDPEATLAALDRAIGLALDGAPVF